MNELQLTELAIQELLEKLERARMNHPPINNRHEAIAVIREEYLEAEMECFKDTYTWSKARVRAELEQIAAMCIRAIVDLEL